MFAAWEPTIDMTQYQIRAAEDILSLTRVLKEAWIFGASAAEKRAEDASQNVFEGIARLRAEGAFDVGKDVVVGDTEMKGVGESS